MRRDGMINCIAKNCIQAESVRQAGSDNQKENKTDYQIHPLSMVKYT